MTEPFPRSQGRLQCGDLWAAELAERFGTPLYVYDIRRIEDRVAAFHEAFASIDHLLAYSVKANGNLSILRRLNALGCGADITSEGELYRVMQAGIPTDRVLFAGVGKTEQEIGAALDAGIYAFKGESAAELERIDDVATRSGKKAPFGVRVNPDVFAKTPHEYTRTGTAATKFGVPWDETLDLYAWAGDRPHLVPLGIDVHIGSQILDPDPYARALDRVLELVAAVKSLGVSLEYLDIGGGYGIPYGDEPGMDIGALAQMIVPRVRDVGLRLILEPGRSIVGDAGLLLTRVQFVKRSGDKTFVIVDGGMSELIRPSHYGGFHQIESVNDPVSAPEEGVDVVGPICESGDFLARDRTMPVPEPGELLAVRTVGAYGFAMASNYNGRLRPAEAMVDGSEVTLIRERETLSDLIRGET